MWTIDKLSERFGLSEQQIYRRIDAARHLLNSQISRGEKNAIQLNEGGFKILESLIGFEKQGQTLSIAVQNVEKELRPQHRNGHDSSSFSLNSDNLHERANGSSQDSHLLHEKLGYLKGQLDLLHERVQRLEAENGQLKEENSWLKAKNALVEVRHERPWWQFWR